MLECFDSGPVLLKLGGGACGWGIVYAERVAAIVQCSGVSPTCDVVNDIFLFLRSSSRALSRRAIAPTAAMKCKIISSADLLRSIVPSPWP